MPFSQIPEFLEVTIRGTLISLLLLLLSGLEHNMCNMRPSHSSLDDQTLE